MAVTKSYRGSAFENTDWQIVVEGTHTVGQGQVEICLLLDIREELRKLNRLLGCSNFTGIPRSLRAIAKNTTKRKYVRKPK